VWRYVKFGRLTFSPSRAPCTTRNDLTASAKPRFEVFRPQIFRSTAPFDQSHRMRRIASHRIASHRIVPHGDAHRPIFRGMGTNHDGIANFIIASIKAYGHTIETPLAFTVISTGRDSTDTSTDSR